MKCINGYISILWILIGFMIKLTNEQIRIQLGRNGGGGIPISLFNFFPNQRENETQNEGDNNKAQGEGKNDEVTTKSFIINSQDGPIRVTQIRVRRNLNNDRERQTPIRIIRDVDSYFDNVFNSFIGNMINMQHMHIINHIKEQKQREELLQQQQQHQQGTAGTDANKQQNQTTKEENEDIDTRLDEDKIPSQEPKNKTESNDNQQNNNDKESSPVNSTPQTEKDTKKKPSSPSLPRKSKTEEAKAKILEYQEKQRNKQKFFAQICKYVFYAIILFSFYVVIRKVFQLLDLVDDNPKPSTESKEDKSINHSEKVEEKKVEIVKTEKVS